MMVDSFLGLLEFRYNFGLMFFDGEFGMTDTFLDGGVFGESIDLVLFGPTIRPHTSSTTSHE